MSEVIDKALKRYKSSRRPDDLATVFDLAAKDLFRLALHTTGSPQSAEDAVQETFLFLIDAVDSFDTSKKAAPWINGILANKAREARRQAARSGAIPLPELPAREARDLAVDRDQVEEVRTALTDLDEPYRTTLYLRLFHDLEPADIAAALNEEPGTIRTRLHRGLEKLRKRLPEGVGLSALILICSPRGMAAVKAQVMGHAAQAAAATTALATAGGVLVMKKIAVFAAVLITAAAIWAGIHSLIDTGADQSDRFEIGDNADASSLQDDPKPRRTAKSSTTPQTSPEEKSEANEEKFLTGRVIDISGLPVVGAAVELHNEQAPLSIVEQAITAFAQPAPAATTTTDSQGQFRFDTEATETPRLVIHSGKHWPALFNCGSARTFEVKLHPMIPTTARVVDKNNQPLEGVKVSLRFAERTRRFNGVLFSRTVESNSKGEFPFPQKHDARETALRFITLKKEGYATEEYYLQYDLKPPGDIQPRFPMKEARRVTFNFEHIHGKKLPKTMRFLVRSSPTEKVVGTAVDGKAELFLGPSAQIEVAMATKGLSVSVHPKAKNRARLGGIVLPVIADGEQTLRVPVSEGGTLKGRVIDQNTGDGIDGVTLTAQPNSLNGLPASTQVLTAVTSNGGRFEFQGLTETWNTVSLENPEWFLSIKDERRDDLVRISKGYLRKFLVRGSSTAGPQEVTLPVERANTFVGRVVNEKLNPIAGATVSSYRLKTRTAADGTFELVGLTPGKLGTLEARADGHNTGRSGPPKELSQNRYDVGDVILHSGYWVRMRVRDPYRELLCGLSVNLELLDDNKNPSGTRLSGSTNHKGLMSIRVDTPGHYRVTFPDGDKFGVAAAPEEIIQVTHGGFLNTLDAMGAYTINVRVQDEQGHPMTGIKVIITPEQLNDTDLERARTLATVVPKDKAKARALAEFAVSRSGRTDKEGRAAITIMSNRPWKVLEIRKGRKSLKIKEAPTLMPGGEIRLVVGE